MIKKGFKKAWNCDGLFIWIKVVFIEQITEVHTIENTQQRNGFY